MMSLLVVAALCVASGQALLAIGSRTSLVTLGAEHGTQDLGQRTGQSTAAALSQSWAAFRRCRAPHRNGVVRQTLNGRLM